MNDLLRVDVKALGQKLRDAGSSPAWCSSFPASKIALRENYYLFNKYFEFDGKYNHQLAGTAMGTKLVPSYANVFMSNFEH